MEMLRSRDWRRAVLHQFLAGLPTCAGQANRLGSRGRSHTLSPCKIAECAENFPRIAGHDLISKAGDGVSPCSA